MKIGILGTTGYTGMLLLRMLAKHPDVKKIYPSSSSKTGESIFDSDNGIGNDVSEKTNFNDSKYISVSELASLKPDVVFSALPHLKSAEILNPFFDKTVIIDLSADFRIKNHEYFLKSYGVKPPRPDLLPNAVYGLAEIYRNEIKKTDLIANPGCYPTCTLLPILPLAKQGLIKGDIIVNALSGISGAGKKVSETYLFCERTESTCPYNPGKKHRHATEIQEQIEKAGHGFNLFFNPHLVPLKRGMEATISIKLNKNADNAAIKQTYENFYKDSQFVKIIGNKMPDTRNIWGSNRCDIGWHIEEDYIFIFSVIDNLVKGASGQAVQNMNIRFGLKETNGLSLSGEV